MYRKDYYNTFDTFVPVLVRMEDPVVNAQLLKNLDPGKGNELNTLSSIADASDPDKDPLTFKRLAKLGNNKINKRLGTRTLPTGIKALIVTVKETVVKAPVVKAPAAKSTAVKSSSKKAAVTKKTTAKKEVAKKKTTNKK